MMKAAIVLLLLTVPVSAQQQQQVSPSNMAVQIDTAVNGMAMALEQAQKTITEQQARIKQLEDKYEPKKSSSN